MEWFCQDGDSTQWKMKILHRQWWICERSKSAGLWKSQDYRWHTLFKDIVCIYIYISGLIGAHFKHVSMLSLPRISRTWFRCVFLQFCQRGYPWFSGSYGSFSQHPTGPAPQQAPAGPKPCARPALNEVYYRDTTKLMGNLEHFWSPKRDCSQHSTRGSVLRDMVFGNITGKGLARI